MLSKLIENHIPVDIGKMRASDFLASQERVELKKLEYVREGHGWKTVDRCPLCDSRDYEHEFEKHGIPLVKCRNCELRYHTKIPADPNDIYQASDYTVYTKGESEEHFNYRRERFGRERIRLLEEHCGDLSDKTLLDVGCGDGYFLSVAKDVCKRCVGSEFSVHLREFAQEKTRVPVYSVPLEDFPERHFDIITAFDVIEHIPAPVPFMQAASDLLTPGGYILLYTPNFDSFSIRVMREHSSIVDGTEHVILFNHTSLRKLGERLGLDMIHTETRGLDINSIIAYQSYIGEEVNAFLEQWLNELQVMIDASECADYLRIIYRKK
jgi:2-polyprenyl-3-methyl-5-hydroxy-6-metoxy-1,4-benzoquinol methylase